MTPRHLVGIMLLPLALVLAGCSSKSAPAKVTGTVTYNSAPVTGGRVDFHSKDGVYSTTLNDKGQYTLVDVPVGEMKVTVSTESLNPKVKQESYAGQMGTKGGGKGGFTPPGGMSGPAGSSKGSFGGKGEKTSPMPEGAPATKVGTYVAIPLDYADQNKTPLKVTVKDGEQTINLELTDIGKK